jgi:hypothetical protein
MIRKVRRSRKSKNDRQYNCPKEEGPNGQTMVYKLKHYTENKKIE